MSAVMTDPNETAVANWQMPVVKVSDPIVWMPDYLRPDGARLAWVTRVSHRSIECLIPGDGVLERRFDVLYLDDPRLPRNANLRQNGAWDYSPESKRLAAVEERLAALEGLATEPKRK
jgi:hypothetical protein